MKSAVTRPRMSQLPSLFQPAPQGAPNLLRARTGASGHPVTAWGQYPIPPSSGQATGSACFGLSSRSLHSPRGKETTRFLWCDPQLRAPVPALARQILFDFPKIIVHIVSDMCRMNFVSDITRTEDANVETPGKGLSMRMRMRMRRTLNRFWLAILALLLLHGQAQAGSILYTINASSTATANVLVDSYAIGAIDFTAGGSTLSGTIRMDDTDYTVTDFNIILGSASTTLSSSYGGYDTVGIVSSSLSDGAAFISTPLGPPLGGTYSSISTPASVASIYDASDSTGTYVSVSGVPLNFSAGAVSVFATPGGMLHITISAVTLAVITPQGLPVVEVHPLQVIGSLQLNATSVPEPSTALLVALGMVGMGMIRRQRAKL